MSDPAKTFPKALAGAVVLVVATYLLPLLMGLGVTLDPVVWKLDDGGYASLAGIVSFGVPSETEQGSRRSKQLCTAVWADAMSTLRPPAPAGASPEGMMGGSTSTWFRNLSFSGRPCRFHKSSSCEGQLFSIVRAH